MKKSKWKLKNTLTKMKIKTKLSKIYGTEQKQFWEDYSNIVLPLETRKISHKHFSSKEMKKGKHKAQSQQKAGNNKDQSRNK